MAIKNSGLMYECDPQHCDIANGNHNNEIRQQIRGKIQA